MTEAHVEIVVVSWNSEDDLAECLDHLSRNTDYANHRVTVIDNDSQDGSRALLRRRSGIQLVELGHNSGWVGAVNAAMQTIAADYYFFLNPDARVQAGWLSPLVEALEDRPEIGFATPTFVSPSGSVYSQGFHVGRTFRIEAYGTGTAVVPGEAPRLVPLCAGMFLVRREVIERVGLLDVGFGLGYFEDADYVLRAHYLGFRTVLVPRSHVVHLVGRSFARLGEEKTRLLAHNWLRLVTLHWPARWLMLRLALEATLPLRVLARGRNPRPFIRALRAWLFQVPALLARRRELAPLRAGTDWRLLREME